MYGPKVSMLRCLSSLNSGVPVKPSHHGFRQQCLHRPVELAGLGAVALVDENANLALGEEVGGQVALNVLDEGVDIAFLRPAELVDQRTDQPFVAGVEDVNQIGAVAGAVDVLADALEYLLDLLVQLGPVGDEHHAGVGDVLANPLRQPHHGQALAAALGVPDDAAFTPLHPRLGCPYAEVLIVTAGLLDAPVEYDEVVHDLEEPLLAAELSQLQEQGIVAGGRVSVVLLPAQPVLLRRPDHAVAQPLGFVSRHHEVHRGKERPHELGLLAVEVLANTL